MNSFLRSLAVFGFVLAFGLCGQVRAQVNRAIFGDLKVDESKVSGVVPISYDVILYSQGGSRLNHQLVNAGGRYRFDVGGGIFDVAVELDNVEIARVRVEMLSPLVTTFQKDIELVWRAAPGGEKKQRAGVVSAADLYQRAAATEKLFLKAEQWLDKKNYAQAASLLQQIVALDPGDYQSWTELGTVYLLQNNGVEAEKSYLRAIEIQPSYLLALLDLGRLRFSQKNLDGAVDILIRALKVRPDSADTNFLLGEACLQMKRGSLAVAYLGEALRLDPVGMADAHLRLATLYHRAGLKEKAAIEYEQFLKKKPDYPERKKLEQYIAANRKR
jgi:tetratricopeptide (TPR) repeat protein